MADSSPIHSQFCLGSSAPSNQSLTMDAQKSSKGRLHRAHARFILPATRPLGATTFTLALSAGKTTRDFAAMVSLRPAESGVLNPKALGLNRT